MLKKHQFWACLMIVSGLMCIFTGHQMVSAHQTKKDADNEE